MPRRVGFLIRILPPRRTGFQPVIRRLPPPPDPPAFPLAPSKKLQKLQKSRQPTFAWPRPTAESLPFVALPNIAHISRDTALACFVNAHAATPLGNARTDIERRGGPRTFRPRQAKNFEKLKNPDSLLLNAIFERRLRAHPQVGCEPARHDCRAGSRAENVTPQVACRRSGSPARCKPGFRSSRCTRT